jgi:alpha-N-arabinofuranosidase
MNAHLVLHADRPGPIINPNIYGQFAEHLGGCIYEGIWVGEDSPIPNTRGLRNDVVAALKNLRVPVVRWPGGCFADEYHWRDGIGPRDQRPRRINTHWGAVVENNHFGTHEFLDFCELIGTQPYVCGNVGSGTPQEMMEWVEYMTSDSDSTLANERRKNGREKAWNVPWFGVGNESWGCGGNMRPEFYADKYRQYRTFVKNYSGNRVQAIGCGSNGTDFNWTDVLMREAQRLMHGLSMHWYALPTNVWAKKGSATEFGEDQYHSLLRQTLEMERLVSKHSEIMDKHDPEKRVGLIVDEWGTWYDPEPGTNPGFLYQQNTLRDALAAAVNFHIFHGHCDRVTMANIAQMINVLQAMILTEGEKMVLTPTYHVFEMYKVHQGAANLPIEIESPQYKFAEHSIAALSASASRDSAGRIHLSVANLDPHNSITLRSGISGVSAKSAVGRILTAAETNTHNTFTNLTAVKPAEFSGITVTNDKVQMELPPKSVVVVEIGSA